MVQAKVKDKQTAFIDPRYKDRSFGEAKLAEIIPLCWAFDPDKRIDIFQLVELLRAAVKLNNELDAQKAQRTPVKFRIPKPNDRTDAEPTPKQIRLSVTP